MSVPMLSLTPQGRRGSPPSGRALRCRLGTATSLVVVAAACVVAACASSRSGSTSANVTPAAAPSPMEAPSPSVAATPEDRATFGESGQSQWSLGQPACPANADSSVSSGARSAAGTTAPTADSGRSAPRSDSASTRRPAIILRASASAQEVRFASQPRIVVRLCGGTLDSVHVIERRNLPSPVVAGTTYRNVYVAVEILGHLDAACIASKLGAGGSAPTPTVCGSLSATDSAGAQRTPSGGTPPPSGP